jgi:pyridoxine kinase
VIAVSSHVAHGGVGNRAAVFALERLGFPVVAVPTVVLPFHPGHGKGTRIVPPADAFAALLADLGRLPPVGAILSGYLGAPEQARAIASLVRDVKARNPSALYLLDPVLGDGGALYMPPAVADAIRDELLPLADIATPNRTELDFLTGPAAEDNAGLIASARKLGPAEIVVTSAFAPAGMAASLLVTKDGAWFAGHAAHPDAPHGVGDLMAALYLAARLDGAAPVAALELAASRTLALIARAVAARSDELPLAAGQDSLLAKPSGVTIEKIG